ncbi:hypothetical protein RND81_09G053300 [Saponaria officinalis]|uniref:Adenylyltransferase and sulfurtransferase MOCS3 n=1 Tax=Saponaria officinalis TaxID=3572 RepID=A0AAW1IHT4_SAPOF
MASNGADPTRILAEIESLKAQKQDIEAQISSLQSQLQKIHHSSSPSISAVHSNLPAHSLPSDAIYRYSRHLLLPSFGVLGQSNLLKSSILVVGAGGLGSPALLYLAACGVGRLGIVDHDVVELNNMHRQVIHTEAYIGKSKVESAAAACHSINSTIEIIEYREALRTSNALEIFSQYDLIIDATDNVPSRYMINDCCVVLKKPLVSGAALGLEGQLTVYNYKGGPCYRCLFPTPPPMSACQRCSDSGVLGVVPGVIGTLQALEAIKIASGIGEPLSGRMLMFDASSGKTRVVKLRGQSPQCKVCGEEASFTSKEFKEFDYEKFTQTSLSTAPPKLKLIPDDSRISCKEYNEKVTSGEAHVLIDVRPPHHFDIISLPNSLNIPLSNLESRLPEISAALKDEEARKGVSGAQLYTVCRRGNDSQRAVEVLHKMGFTSAKDIVGGITSWAQEVDPNFPAY